MQSAKKQYTNICIHAHTNPIYTTYFLMPGCPPKKTPGPSEPSFNSRSPRKTLRRVFPTLRGLDVWPPRQRCRSGIHGEITGQSQAVSLSLEYGEDDVKIPNKGFAIFGWEKIYDVFILEGFMDQHVMSSWWRPGGIQERGGFWHPKC